MSLHQRHWKKVKTGKFVNETEFLLKTYPPYHELGKLFFKDQKFNLVSNKRTGVLRDIKKGEKPGRVSLLRGLMGKQKNEHRGLLLIR